MLAETGKLLIIFLLSSILSAKVNIIPSGSTVLAQGTSLQLQANVPVTWSLAPGSPGTIDPDGIYHAPIKVNAQQSIGGCQLLPNTHVYNTPIDNLPVHPNSAKWIADSKSGLGGAAIKFSPAFPVTYKTNADPQTWMRFAYTPDNNGLFWLPTFPGDQIESGRWTWDVTDRDRHAVIVNHDTCTINEIYNLYPAGFSQSCPTCTSQSGTQYQALDSRIPKAGTDAAGLQLLPLLFRLDEIRAGAINHLLRFTIDRTDDHWLWPATSSAAYGHSDTKMPLGARVRLKAGFDVDSLQNPVSKVLAIQLMRYGLILSDRGYNWEIQGAADPFPDDIRNAFAEIRSRISATDMEVVDESSLMMAADSGATALDEVRVTATSLDNPNDSADIKIGLSAIGVGVSTPTEVIQAGSAAKQLTAWVTGTSDSRLVWSISPDLGTISDSGVYQPPDSVDTPTTTTITVRSYVDLTSAATIQVTVLPPGVIRLNAGDSVDYTDSNGNIWWGDNVPGRPMILDNSYPYDFTSGHAWKNTSDSGLFDWARANLSDITYKFTVPNGFYRVRLKLAENAPRANQRVMHLETQGQVIYRDFDGFKAAGGSDTAVDVEMPAVVTDGTLYVSLRARGVLPAQMNSCCSTPIYPGGYSPQLSALEIIPDSGAPQVTIQPTASQVHVLEPVQFYALPWFAPDTKLIWSISPKIGTIDQNGLYTGPAVPVTQEVAVHITATSATDPNNAASATVTILPGVPDVRINCGSLPGFTDAHGQRWSSDYGYSAGTVTYDNRSVKIPNVSEDMQSLYQSSRYRYDNEAFYYAFDLPNGTYTVTLKFADYVYSTPGGIYTFDVKLNGTTVLNNFDPDREAGGGHRAIDKSFSVTVTNLKLRLDFLGHKGGAIINGIEIVRRGP